jgi:hypothetical protein
MSQIGVPGPCHSPLPWLISLTHDLPNSLVLSLPLKNRYPSRLFRLPRSFPARGVRPRALSGPSRRFTICSILVRLMKTTVRSMFVAMILSTMLLSSGCEKKTAATDPTAQSTPGSTKPLEAADLVGYDGKRLRKSVDRIREGNEKHNKELEKMAGSGPDQ